VHDNAPGKYHVGLQQKRIAFCGDNEDAMSRALTALTRLLQCTGVSYKAIGRLEWFFLVFFF
jgi:hydroxymethylglutaryl-CoA synthase